MGTSDMGRPRKRGRVIREDHSSRSEQQRVPPPNLHRTTGRIQLESVSRVQVDGLPNQTEDDSQKNGSTYPWYPSKNVRYVSSSVDMRSRNDVKNHDWRRLGNAHCHKQGRVSAANRNIRFEMDLEVIVDQLRQKLSIAEQNDRISRRMANHDDTRRMKRVCFDPTVQILGEHGHAEGDADISRWRG